MMVAALPYAGGLLGSLLQKSPDQNIGLLGLLQKVSDVIPFGRRSLEPGMGLTEGARPYGGGANPLSLTGDGLRNARGELSDLVKDAKSKGVDLSADADPTGIVLSWIESNGMNKGAGTEAIHKLTSIADKYGSSVDLTALGGDPGLVNYYKRFGFEPGDTSDDGLQMRREPQTRPFK